MPVPTRADAWARLAREAFDVLVIGGGITGAGIARDAARRGLRTALLEADDFAAGTSSRSSRLVHGGVRYLEHGWLHLVFEASRERRTLLRIAPHLVRPLRFTWPVYEGARVPRWKLAAGLALYDLLALFRNVGRARSLGPAGVQAAEPAVARDALAGGAQYWDAATNDARLTLANALDAAASGAVVLNHATVRSLVVEAGRVVGAVVEDRETGARVTARARTVVNAAGPWSDGVRAMAEPPDGANVRGTKGVHVAVPRERLGIRGALTLLSPVDGRVMFALPAGDFAILGTTDTFTTQGPDDVRADEGDVAYLLTSANRFFPEARLERDDVVSAWAGLRPLVATPPGTPPGSASREHRLERATSGLFSITGGKLTTYRAMAEEVVDAVARAIGIATRLCDTARAPLPGGEFGDAAVEVAAAAAATGDARWAEHLVTSYGTQWREVHALALAEPALAAPIAPPLPYRWADVAWAADAELARTVADVLVRRTFLAFERRDHGRALAPAVAAVLAARLGWTTAERDRAASAYDAEAARLFAVEETATTGDLRATR